MDYYEKVRDLVNSFMNQFHFDRETGEFDRRIFHITTTILEYFSLGVKFSEYEKLAKKCLRKHLELVGQKEQKDTAIKIHNLYLQYAESVDNTRKQMKQKLDQARNLLIDYKPKTEDKIEDGYDFED